MPDAIQGQNRTAMWAVVLVTLAITALFVGMIRDFLVALLLAAIFSAMAAPLQAKISSLVGGRSGLAATITLAILLICVLTPILVIIYISATQASEVIVGLENLIQRFETEWPTLQIPDSVPFKEKLEDLGGQIAAKAGELAGRLATLFISFVSAATRGTAGFFLNLFVMVYAMVFFLQKETAALAQLARYTGLNSDAQKRLVDTIISVSRATIKGTVLIGIVQGALGGIAFAFIGIQAAAFWGVIMAVASIILPAIGSAIVWLPAVIYLVAIGDIASAIGLALWCAIVIGLSDNLLRPILVGRETPMDNLMVLISTFGGLAVFGAVGLIIGPVIGGVFVTVWQIFRETHARTLSGT